MLIVYLLKGGSTSVELHILITHFQTVKVAERRASAE
jgi:hypothetical protein